MPNSLEAVLDERAHLQKFRGDEDRDDVLHAEGRARLSLVNVQLAQDGAVEAIGRMLLVRARLMLLCNRQRLVLGARRKARKRWQGRQKRGREKLVRVLGNEAVAEAGGREVGWKEGKTGGLTLMWRMSQSKISTSQCTEMSMPSLLRSKGRGT